MNRPAVSLAESAPVVADELAFNLGMFIPLVIVCIAVVATFVVVARCLNSIAVTLPLCIAVLRRRLIPASLALVLRRCRCGRCCIGRGGHSAGCGTQRYGQGGNCKTCLRHQRNLLAFQTLRDDKGGDFCCSARSISREEYSAKFPKCLNLHVSRLMSDASSTGSCGASHRRIHGENPCDNPPYSCDERADSGTPCAVRVPLRDDD